MAFFVRELSSFLKDFVEQEGSDCQTSRGSGASDEIEHDLERVQRLSSPVDRDLTEETILDRVVFGSACGIMADQDGDAQFVGELLEFILPEPEATIVATTGIAQDQKRIFLREAWPLRIVPPGTNGFHSEFGCVVRRRDIDAALIVKQIIDAEGHRHGQSILAKVVAVDAFRLLAPDATFIEEGANHLFVLGIDAEYRSSALTEKLLDPLNVVELTVSVGMWRSTQALAVGYQPNLLFLQ